MLRRLSSTEREHVVDAMQLIQTSLAKPGEAAVTEPAAAHEHKRDDEFCTLREHRAGDMGWIVSRQGALCAKEYGWTTEYEALAADIVAQFLKNFAPARSAAGSPSATVPRLVP